MNEYIHAYMHERGALALFFFRGYFVYFITYHIISCHNISQITYCCLFSNFLFLYISIYLFTISFFKKLRISFQKKGEKIYIVSF